MAGFQGNIGPAPSDGQGYVQRNGLWVPAAIQRDGGGYNGVVEGDLTLNRYESFSQLILTKTGAKTMSLGVQQGPGEFVPTLKSFAENGSETNALTLGVNGLGLTNGSVIAPSLAATTGAISAPGFYASNTGVQIGAVGPTPFSMTTNDPYFNMNLKGGSEGGGGYIHVFGAERRLASVVGQPDPANALAGKASIVVWDGANGRLNAAELTQAGLALTNGSFKGSGSLLTFDEPIYLPRVYGSLDAGACFYGIQTCVVQRVGGYTRLTINVTWSGHTGTGDLRIDNVIAFNPSIVSIAATSFQVPQAGAATNMYGYVQPGVAYIGFERLDQASGVSAQAKVDGGTGSGAIFMVVEYPTPI